MSDEAELIFYSGVRQLRHGKWSAQVIQRTLWPEDEVLEALRDKFPPSVSKNFASMAYSKPPHVTGRGTFYLRVTGGKDDKGLTTMLAEQLNIPRENIHCYNELPPTLSSKQLANDILISFQQGDLAEALGVEIPAPDALIKPRYLVPAVGVVEIPPQPNRKYITAIKRVFEASGR